MLKESIGPRGGSARSGLWAAPDRAGGPGSKGGKQRILIVEDDYFVAVELEHRLREAGYDVVGVASSAAEAIGLARDTQPMLAIMDIRLAGNSDGVDAAITLSSEYQIPSIFATAHADPQTRQRAEKANPRAWISKPYDAQTVIAAIRSVLRE
jgi:two-component system, response regulator PdtaR